MKHVNYLDVEGVRVDTEGAHGIHLRTVIGESDGAPNFFMRVVEFDTNGSSPHHSHPWEHENFIISGKGTLEVEGQIVELKPGDVTYVPPNAEHCFRAKEPMVML